MTEPLEPTDPGTLVVEPYRFRLIHNGRVLVWVVPGYTHFVASLN